LTVSDEPGGAVDADHGRESVLPRDDGAVVMAPPTSVTTPSTDRKIGVQLGSVKVVTRMSPA
jgi:hypothetical protein